MILYDYVLQQGNACKRGTGFRDIVPDSDQENILFVHVRIRGQGSLEWFKSVEPGSDLIGTFIYSYLWAGLGPPGKTENRDGGRLTDVEQTLRVRKHVKLC